MRASIVYAVCRGLFVIYVVSCSLCVLFVVDCRSLQSKYRKSLPTLLHKALQEPGLHFLRNDDSSLDCQTIPLSGCRELNPVYLLPKQAYYRYTTSRQQHRHQNKHTADIQATRNAHTFTTFKHSQNTSGSKKAQIPLPGDSMLLSFVLSTSQRLSRSFRP